MDWLDVPVTSVVLKPAGEPSESQRYREILTKPTSSEALQLNVTGKVRLASFAGSLGVTLCPAAYTRAKRIIKTAQASNTLSCLEDTPLKRAAIIISRFFKYIYLSISVN